MMMIMMSSLSEMQDYLSGNMLEHAYGVMASALSCQPEIQADCMEQLSNDNIDLRKMVDEVASCLHYQCPKKKVVNKSIDEVVDIF